MATLALTAVGTAIAGPAGGILGAIIGGAIDNYVIAPTLFPDEEPNGPRFDINTAIDYGTEGTPARYPIGPRVRLPGMLIWAEDVTGANASQGKVNLAIAVSQDKEIVEFRKMWADGKVLWDGYGNSALVTDTNIEMLNPVASGNNIFLDAWIRQFAPDASHPFADFQIGAPLTVSGFSTASLNGDYTITQYQYCNAPGTPPGDDYDLLLVRPQVPVGVSEGPGPSVTLSQTVPPYTSDQFDDIRFYTGSLTQAVDPIIALGIAFRGKPYVVIEGLKLGKFGNRIPPFEFLVDADGTITVGDAIGQIIESSGILGASDYDASLANDSLRGYYIDGPQAPSRSIQPILQAYNLLVQESSGIIRVFPRDQAEVISVADGDDLAAREDGSGDVPSPVSVSDSPEVQLTSQVTVQFVEETNDFQQGSQTERAIYHPNQKHVGINLPLVLTATQAREVARKKLWSDRAGNQHVDLTLPPEYFYVKESDVLQFTAFGQDFEIIVMEVSRGANFLMEISGIVQAVSSSDQTASADDPIHSGGQGVDEEQVIFEALCMIPAISNDDTSRIGFYLGLTGTNPNVPFSGATLYVSDSEDGSFVSSAVVDAESESVTGFAITALGDGPIGLYDRENTVDIVLRGTDQELEQATDSEILLGANTALLGKEVIQFRDVENIDDRTWRISYLLRGRRNTEMWTNSHYFNAADAFAETFVLLRGVTVAQLQFVERSASALQWWKGVRAGADVSLVPAFAARVLAESRRCFSPTSFEGTRDGSDNITLNWIRRTRLIAPIVTDLTEEYGEEYLILPFAAESLIWDGYVSIGGGLVTRTDGSSWTDDGFAVGMNFFLYRTLRNSHDGGQLQGRPILAIEGGSNESLRVSAGLSYSLLDDADAYVRVVANAAALRTITVDDATTEDYTAAQQTTDGITPGDPVTFRIHQNGYVGPGHHTEMMVS